MTPEQLKQKPFEEMIKILHEKLDTEEGESNKDEKKTITYSDIPEQDSASDTSTVDEEESNTTLTFQVHNGWSNTMHDQDDSIHDEDNSSEPEHESSEEESVHKIHPYTVNGEQSNEQDNKFLTTNFEVKVEN